MTIGSPLKPARRTATMDPSALREILKQTERRGASPFAGSLPSPKAPPFGAMGEACERVLREAPQASTLRLSFVAASWEQIETGIAALTQVIPLAREKLQ